MYFSIFFFNLQKLKLNLFLYNLGFLCQSCLKRSSSNSKLLKTTRLIILFLKHKILVYLASLVIHKHERPRLDFIFFIHSKWHLNVIYCIIHFFSLSGNTTLSDTKFSYIFGDIFILPVLFHSLICMKL